MDPSTAQQVVTGISAALKEALDAYLASTPSSTWQIVGTIAAAVSTLIALVTAIIMMVTTRSTLARMKEQIDHAEKLATTQTKESNETFFSERWDQLFAECVEHPELLDAAMIESIYGGTGEEHGFERPSQETQMRYSAFCYRLWNLVSEIVKRGFTDQPRFKALINWAKELHGDWLVRNPDFFSDENFWNAIEEAKSNPHMIMRYKALPRRSVNARAADAKKMAEVPVPDASTNAAPGPESSLQAEDIDWGYIGPRYFAYILSPCHPDMLSTAGRIHPRNMLVEKIKEKSDSLRKANRSIRIIEFGCGPGTLVDVLVAGKITEIEQIVFVDRNPIMLDQARVRLANAPGLRMKQAPEFVCADMTRYRYVAQRSGGASGMFDAVVSINSVLSTKREEVVSAFRTFREHKNSTGDVYAILPSFDTTEYLENLWYAKARSEVASPGHADRVRVAFQKNKRKRGLGQYSADERDFSDQSFADDGSTEQGYHTRRSIKAEMGIAELDVVEMDPVFYPWDLCQRFDYGNFKNPLELLRKYENHLEAKHWNLAEQPYEEIWDWYVRAR